MRQDYASPNYNSRDGVAPDMLVLHYTGMKNCGDALEKLCDPEAEVSAHYLIDEDGTVYQLVDEAARAWHAGVASWRGGSNINSRSIGIELVNPGHEFGYRAFPEAQMQALMPLCRDIVARHAIAARNVVGHSDVAPLRKTDPGELFDWARLAAEGIGLWPDMTADPCDAAAAPALLTEIGYDTADETAALTAFQRHFAPHRLDGEPDRETLRALAAVHALI
ncbi:N-acetylmuramoyl-L-alanine amidase [Thalassospiraceae bacterium LMO-JJ14]|nr:N-acetylmuramoyl-L-alanine amidase [Thalassospiraceae bacterium LMO-JJ14]